MSPYLVWGQQQTEPVLLVAGGSGLVPLMSMVRAREAAGSRTPFRLLYAVRAPSDLLYRSELRKGAPGLDTTYLYSREAPAGSPRRAGAPTAAARAPSPACTSTGTHPAWSHAASSAGASCCV
ncbi:hypothetical protein GCM10009802_00170 [Streptomyces synnematoformans]|uniref:Oxidoreductase FAD/NAD(P)-binding domain-containing protein n=1 Tax=Streptomyces synnematoformans TaxID=415721 RepID=A0ABN2X7F3_9ACTN